MRLKALPHLFLLLIITAVFLSVPPDLCADDHGDNYSTATHVSINSSVGGIIETAADSDYFSFDASLDKIYRIETLPGNIGITTIYLYSKNGTSLIASDDNSGTGSYSKIVWRCTSAGTYYVEVKGNGTSTGSYQLAVFIVSDDHGNTYSTATQISLDKQIEGSIEVAGDVDYFGFDATAGKAYSIKSTLETLNASTVVFFDTNGTKELANASGTEDYPAKITWNCSKSGKYYIAVKAYSGSTATGSYTLSVSINTSDDHSDNYYFATPISDNSPVKGDLESYGDVDFFSFSALAGRIYTIDVMPGTLVDSFMFFYDIDGTTVLAFDDDSGTEYSPKITWQCATAGTYYASVEGYYPANMGTYTITLTEAFPDDHGDDSDTSTYISIGPSVGGAIEAPGDVDCFGFTASSKMTYVIEISHDTLAGSKASLYNTTALLLSSDSQESGSPYIITWNCATFGMYYIIIEGETASDTGTYTLKVSASDTDGGSGGGDDTGDGGSGGCFIAQAAASGGELHGLVGKVILRAAGLFHFSPERSDAP